MDRIRCAARAGCLPSHPIHPTASLPPSLSPIRAILLTRAHQQLQFSLLDFLLEDAEACLLAHIERLIDAVHGALNLAACACLELAQRAQPVAKIVFGNLAASAVGHAPQFLNDPHPLLLAAPARFLQHAQFRQKRVELRIVQAQKILRLHQRVGIQQLLNFARRQPGRRLCRRLGVRGRARKKQRHAKHTTFHSLFVWREFLIACCSSSTAACCSSCDNWPTACSAEPGVAMRPAAAASSKFSCDAKSPITAHDASSCSVGSASFTCATPFVTAAGTESTSWRPPRCTVTTTASTTTATAPKTPAAHAKIGRASCRERG